MKLTLAQWQKFVKSTDDFILQGSTIDEWDGWQPFPIGMTYNWVDYKEKWNQMQIGEHEQLLLVAFGARGDHLRRTKPKNRQSILFTLQYKGFRNFLLTHEQYYMRLRNFKFVASPEGNGIDCHRTYEALMAGCIPIVEDHPGIRKKYEGCPILYTNDYKEINSTYLLSKYENMLHQTYDFSRLLYSCYSPELQSDIRKSCLHWMNMKRPNFPPFYKEDGEQTSVDADSIILFRQEHNSSNSTNS